MFIGTVVNQLMIFATPLLITWYMKSDVKKLFHFNSPKAKPFIGSLIFYVGIYLVVILSSVLLTAVFKDSAQNVNATFDALLQQPFPLVVLVIAVMPAIGEELMFRGLIYGSMRSRFGAGRAILISSLIFGLFHMSLVKLIPTALLGACLAIVVEKGGSIFVSMLLHFINNLISVIAMCYPKALEKVLPFLAKDSYAVWEAAIMVVVAAICIAAGYAILPHTRKAHGETAAK